MTVSYTCVDKTQGNCSPGSDELPVKNTVSVETVKKPMLQIQTSQYKHQALAIIKHGVYYSLFIAQH